MSGAEQSHRKPHQRHQSRRSLPLYKTRPALHRLPFSPLIYFLFTQICPSCRTPRLMSWLSTPSALLRYVLRLAPPASTPAPLSHFFRHHANDNVCLGGCHCPGQFWTSWSTNGNGARYKKIDSIASIQSLLTCSSCPRPLQQVYDLQPQEPRLGQPRSFRPLVRTPLPHISHFCSPCRVGCCSIARFCELWAGGAGAMLPETVLRGVSRN